MGRPSEPWVGDSRGVGRKGGGALAAICVMLFFGALLGYAPGTASAGPKQLTIDGFNYQNAAAAAAAWVAKGGSPSPGVAKSGPWGSGRLTVFPCDFSAGGRDRCYWDRAVALDLSSYVTIALRVYCDDPAPIDSITLYFRSGAGWYGANAKPGAGGWSTLVFDRESFWTEGTPSGWNEIDGIRLSPWRGAKQDTTLYADRLWADTPAILVVRPTKTEASSGEDLAAYCAPYLDWLGLYGLPVEEITDEDVEAGLLDGASLAILPYNPVTSALEIQQIQAFVSGGGKLVAAYDVDPALTDLLGVRQISWDGTDVCAMRFRESTMIGLPVRAGQGSWNFMRATPDNATTQVAADWEDCNGSLLDHPALLCSPKGAYFTHVLLDDDPVNKQQLLLALIANLVPDLQRDVAGSALKRMGRIALYSGFAEAVRDIRIKGQESLHPQEVAADLRKAQTQHTAAKDAYQRGAYPGTLAPAFEGRRQLTTAYALSQLPQAGEFRAVWNHSGTGAWPGDWARSAAELAKNGFTAVLPNMLWGGLAHYPSKHLPRSDAYRTYGDQIAQCLAACKPLGIQVHVWKVDWNLATSPQAFIDRMRSQQRTQVDVNGRNVDWLCPSNPLNRQLELATLMEVAAHYDVDGIHFDYIRYPDDTTCYCAGCRARFEAYRGSPVAQWPNDCYRGELRAEYRHWRCLQITALVRDVHHHVKAVKPELKISAAVFSDYPDCRRSVGQDWVQWINKGYLDFVCPMDYTAQASDFAAMVARQKGLVNGLVPVYPGIGASLGLGVDQVIVQILETRRQATSGFTLFNYDSYLSEGILGLLGRATTAPLPVSGRGFYAR